MICIDYIIMFTDTDQSKISMYNGILLYNNVQLITLDEDVNKCTFVDVYFVKISHARNIRSIENCIFRLMVVSG